MLTLEIMGLLGLAILWVNTLLVVGAALTPLAELLSRLRRGFRRGEIEEGADDGVLAAHVVEQVGRQASDDAARQAILFHDRAYRSELAGGVVALDGERLSLDAGAPVEVWFSQEEKRERAESAASDFDEAYRASKKAKGFVRDIACALREGQPVWLAQGSDRAPLLLASFDPRGFLRARIAIVIGFQLAMLAISALLTWLCLHPPVFGTVSTVGGALALVHFLLVMQPLGVTVRELALLPHQAIVRGTWVKTGSEGAGVAALGQDVI